MTPPPPRSTLFPYTTLFRSSNPRLFACMQVYGDALSMPVPDVDRTRYLLMLGANPRASGGSQMVLGNPRRLLRSEEHTSELQSRRDLVCRLLLEKKKKKQQA